MEALMLIAGYVIVVLIAALGLLILWSIWSGKIDLKLLISERDGTASMSRFQFLIFTFVIAMSLILLVIAKIKANQFGFPEIDNGVWALLGISGGSYVVSKGIQKTKDDSAPPAKPDAPPQAPPAGDAPSG